MADPATLITAQRIYTGFVYVITNSWTHLRKWAPEYTVQYETPRQAQRGASVTGRHWSNTVHLKSERDINEKKHSIEVTSHS